MAAPLRVLHAAAEIFPHLKTGGLADVVGALPESLASQGVDVRLVLPGLPAIRTALRQPKRVFETGPLFGAARVRLLRGHLEGSGLPAYVIESPWHYDRDGGPYQGPDGREWSDNLQRFALLGWCAAHLAAGELEPDWTPDVLHAHDWHAALACTYLAARPGTPARSVFTVHNLAYQGLFPAADFAQLGLPARYAQTHGGLEYHGQLSFMKGGLSSADRVTTVSPTYAREITTREFGCGLEGVIATRAGALTGILNGVDYAIWDPARDPELPANYPSIGDEPAAAPRGKAACKLALQREFGLTESADAPLFGVVSRLSHQKGLDLLLQAVPALLAQGGQLVVLGSGDPSLEHAFQAAAAAHRDRIGVRIGYDERLARRVIAGADVIVLPSRFEPCGLTQLYGMRYGTLPLVRRVGGLADTVDDTTGFTFREPESTLVNTIGRTIRRYRDDRPGWLQMMQAAMQRDFSWTAVAASYVRLYGELAPKRGDGG